MMKSYGRKKGRSNRPFILRFHSEIIATDLFKRISGNDDRRWYYRFIDTPFRMSISTSAKSLNDINWQIDSNSKVARELLSKNNKRTISKPKPIKRINPKDIVRAKRPNFINLSKQEFSSLLIQILDQLPDYIQEGYVCNMHIFVPMEEEDE